MPSWHSKFFLYYIPYVYPPITIPYVYPPSTVYPTSNLDPPRLNRLIVLPLLYTTINTRVLNPTLPNFPGGHWRVIKGQPRARKGACLGRVAGRPRG